MMISTMLEVGQTYSLIPLRECYFQISLDRCDFGHEFCKTLRQVLGRNSTSDMPPLRVFFFCSANVRMLEYALEPTYLFECRSRQRSAPAWRILGINIELTCGDQMGFGGDKHLAV